MSSSSHPYWKYVALPNYKTLNMKHYSKTLPESKNLAKFSLFDLAWPFNGCSSSPCVGSTLLFRYIIGICIVLKNPYNDGPLVSQLVRHFVRMYLIQEVYRASLPNSSNSGMVQHSATYRWLTSAQSITHTQPCCATQTESSTHYLQMCVQTKEHVQETHAEKISNVQSVKLVSHIMRTSAHTCTYWSSISLSTGPQRGGGG